MAKKNNYQFRYVGHGPVQSLLTPIGKQNVGVLMPGDQVVVGDVDEAIWLRGLSDFIEVESPTERKPTHKKPAAKKKPAK